LGILGRELNELQKSLPIVVQLLGGNLEEMVERGIRFGNQEIVDLALYCHEFRLLATCLVIACPQTESARSTLSTTSSMQQRPVGKQGLKASAQGLGCMGLTWAYSPGTSDAIWRKSEAVLDAALVNGVNLLSTAWIYSTPGLPTNHEVIGKAIKKHGRDKWVIADKIGVDLKKAPKIHCQSPEELEAQIDDALRGMGTDYVDVVVLNRPDPSRDIQQTCKALKKIADKGKFKYLGLSEATPDEIRRAHAVFPVTLIEQELSLHSRDAEKDLLPTTRELGIAVLAYSPLGRGMLTDGIKSRSDLKPDDWRLMSPRFSEQHINENVKRAEKLKALADAKSLTPAQLALAWLHQLGDDIFPIPGTTNPERVAENAKAVGLKLSKAEMAEIESNVPEAVGSRYPGQHGQYNTRLAPPKQQ